MRKLCYSIPSSVITTWSIRLLSTRVHELFLKICLCSLVMMCLGFQAQAQTQTPANTNPAAEATTATAAGAAAPSGDYDRSKVPPVTAPSRPGLFMLPPTNPGFYSLLDLITGNKREKPLLPHTTLIFVIWIPPGMKKISLIQSKEWILATTGCFLLVVISGTGIRMRQIAV